MNIRPIRLHSKIDSNAVGDLIVGGDFNFTLDEKLDRIASGQIISNNDRCKGAVEHFMYEYNLTGVWRAQNPYKRECTYIRKNLKSMSRIDFSYLVRHWSMGVGRLKRKLMTASLRTTK